MGGGIPLKSISFMKIHYLLFTVFYENQYLSAGKEMLYFSDFQDLLSLPFKAA